MKKISSFFIISLIILLHASFYCQDFRGSATSHEPKSIGSLKGLETGKQYLVLIAIEKYRHWNPISGPVSEARELKKELTSRYYIDEVTELYNSNATKKRIIELFKELQSRIEYNDSLLLFFSGHGYLHELSNNGFWIPVDGGIDENEMEKWIANSIIKGLIANIKSKHILLISDSCYSGELIIGYKGTRPPVVTYEYFRRAYSRRCRQVLTSGSSERVPSKSEFFRHLILALKENNDPYFDASMLFNEIKLGVKKTLPLFGELKGTYHQEGACFLLFLKETNKKMKKEELKNQANKPIVKSGEYSNPFSKRINMATKRIYKNEKGYWEAEYNDGIKMVYIPAGWFIMGSDDDQEDEKPQHEVYLDGYWIGKAEVTFSQYVRFCKATGKKTPNDEGWGRKNRPVINVSWNDAKAYCDWLSKETGLQFKLPSEAQWEKAGRGTDGRLYPWGNSAPSGDKANFAEEQLGIQKEFSALSWIDKSIDDGYAFTSPVGLYPMGISPYGCLDMAGNVWEWCDDCYDVDFYKKQSHRRNPINPKKSVSPRVIRGGSWLSDVKNLRCSNRVSRGGWGSYAEFMRRILRGGIMSIYGNNFIGLRLCQDNE